ncbi:MAG: Rieske 2Fe-2S domain-containing protein [Planctomycetes bacterium]|nr:Rieske 2Fe-2S domain-containing protein [Planctomycetota bacterium]
MTVPHPYPAGWYRFRYSHELERERVVSARFFGRPFVGYRAASGAVSVFDAHCVHLGAHLGDGRVVDDALRCPFHGWTYDGAGRCVQVPFCREVPEGARVRSHPVVERNGTIYVWHDTTGAPPWFDVPEVPETSSPDWKRGPVHRAVIRSRVHEPRENAVDTSHGPVLHARTFPPYPGTKGEIRNWHEDPVAKRLSFDLVNTFGYRGGRRETTLGFELVGPGHLVMRSRLPTDTLFLVPNTPVDEERIVFTMLTFVRRSRLPLVDSVLASLALRHLVRGLREDYVVFERKRYLDAPLLSPADGPILDMRRWMAQFAPPTAEADAPVRRIARVS